MNSARVASYPFSAPAVSPWMNCRWKMIYTMITGKLTMVAPAIVRA